jgi:hypothetical protein
LYCDVLHPQDGNDSGVVNVPVASNTLNLLLLLLLLLLRTYHLLCCTAMCCIRRTAMIVA